MGRQIAVKLSRKKEEEFSEFLKTNNCVFIVPWSDKKKINLFESIPPEDFVRVLIWNKKFKLYPKFTEVKKEYRSRTGGKRYGFRDMGSPVIEYCRKPFYRIYWEKYFTTNNPDYNVEEFEKWYNEVVKWIKKNCKYVEGVYFG